MRLITNDLVAQELGPQLHSSPASLRPILTATIAEFASKYVSAERSRCRILCKRRAELWRTTKGAGTALGAEEGRCRANEADYLADLISVDQS
jgi:hypothetical protein